MKRNEKTNSVCPKCNTVFECGISAGKNSCWCFGYQSLVAPEYGEGCFCEKCLKEFIEKQHEQSTSK
ncbi:MAG: cysteine-rich CWC family protein [Bacteroidota bacterium]|nr:cysteine-rich CWC family protein [Bacteroidota bacterium]